MRCERKSMGGDDVRQCDGDAGGVAGDSGLALAGGDREIKGRTTMCESSPAFYVEAWPRVYPARISYEMILTLEIRLIGGMPDIFHRDSFDGCKCDGLPSSPSFFMTKIRKNIYCRNAYPIARDTQGLSSWPQSRPACPPM